MITSTFPMTTTSTRKERLRQIIVDTSFRSSSKPEFRLSSGQASKDYVDCKMAISHAETRTLVGELIVEGIPPTSVDAVGGLELGAYPIACAVSDAFDRRKEKVPAFVVRKEPKSHGLRKNIEGDVKKGDRVLIVDDVITTGKSTIDAIVKSREEGLEVVKVIAVIDREEADGVKKIQGQGVSFEALFTLEDVRRLETGSKAKLAR